MKLIKDSESAWETYMIEGYPFGIEKIAPRDYVVFRLWGSRRVYLRDEGFTSKAQALAYLAPIVDHYERSIIRAITG
jgi:hypothetical protein